MDLRVVAHDEKTVLKSHALSSQRNPKLRTLSIVLILSGKSFIFFTVASTELCFGFMLKTELATQGFFIIDEQSLHKKKSFFLPLIPSHQ